MYRGQFESLARCGSSQRKAENVFVYAFCSVSTPRSGQNSRPKAEDFSGVANGSREPFRPEKLQSSDERGIRAVGARPHRSAALCPDLNPTEQVFAKLETLLRKAEAGSVEETWKSISTALDAVTPDEGTNHLINAGYAPM